MKWLSVFLIIILLFVVGCGEQKSPKVSESVNGEVQEGALQGESGEESTKKPTEGTQEESTEEKDAGVSDQELEDLEKELNEELVEDVEEMSFE